MNDNITLRIAHPDDAAALLAIYAPYVEHTAITYEYTVPTVEEFSARIEHTLQKYPYIVAERGGELIGYAYTGRFTRARHTTGAPRRRYICGATAAGLVSGGGCTT